MQALLECDDLGDNDKKIPISSSKFQRRPPQSRAVISGVPLEMSDKELLENLSQICVVFVRRLKRRTDGYTSFSRLPDLRVEESRVGRHVKPPRYG